MQRNTWAAQLGNLLKRNCIIISRVLLIISIEIFAPLLFIGLVSSSINRTSIEKLMLKDDSIYQLSFDRYHDYLYYVSPNDLEVQKVMNGTVIGRNSSVSYFVNETEASLQYLKDSHYNIIGIHFFNKTSYMIRFPHKMLPTKDNLFADLSKRCVLQHSLEICTSKLYVSTGFAWLQMQINSAILKRMQLEIDKPVYFEKLVSNIKVNHLFYVLCAFCFIILFVGLFNTFVVSLVGERGSNVVEYMNIMGMWNSAYLTSWSLIYVVFVVILTSLACLLSQHNFALKHTNFILFFIFLCTYGFTFIALGLVMVPLFKNSNMAGHAVSSFVILYTLIFIFMSQFEFEQDVEGGRSVMAFYIMVLFSFVSPIAFSFGINQIMHLESNRMGLTMETFFLGRYSVFLSFSMLIVDILVYILLSICLYKIKRDHMKVKDVFRILNCLQQRKNRTVLTEQEMIIVQHLEEDISADNPERSPSVVVKGLYKIYEAGKPNEVTALDNFTLNIYDNEITAIIGHNGAGKTTLFNILSGISSSTSGTIKIFGLDASDKKQLNEIRSLVSLCSQLDLLHPDLTASEHFQFFTNLKHSNSSNIMIWVNELIPEDMKNVQVSRLSVGQKQRLKLAVALIGDPRVLLLDEPTTGMDVLARNNVWKLLKNLKSGRVIILSTHHMDEADILADKKAILCNGSLKCFGTSLFLKTHFGIGYHLSVVVTDSSMFDAATLLIKSSIQTASVERSFGNNIVFNLPLSTKPQFSVLFRKIEEQMDFPTDLLTILNFSITMTTLEEVFVRIQTNTESENADRGNIDNSITTQFCNKLNEMRGSRAFHIQLCCLVTRKLKEDLRSVNLFVAKLCFPFLFLLCYLFNSRFISSKFSQDSYSSPVLLDYSLYDSVNDSVVVYSDVPESEIFIERFRLLENFVTDISFGFKYTPHIGLNISQNEFQCMYQDSVLHAIPILVNLVSNAIMSTSSYANDSMHKIISYSWAWPLTSKDSFIADIQHINQMLYFISFAFLTVSSMFSVASVVERNNKCLRQLKLADIKCGLYWLSNLICDSLQLTVLLILSLTIFFVGPNFFIDLSFYFIVLLILLLHIPFLLLFSYVITLPCTNASFVQYFAPIIFYLFGYLPHLVILYINMNESHVSSSIKILLSIIDPPYGLTLTFDSFHSLYEVIHYDQTSGGLSFYFSENYWTCFAAPGLGAIIYFSILLSYDKLKEFFSFQRYMHSLCKKTDANDTGENFYFASNESELDNSDLFVKNPVISVKNVTRFFGSTLKDLLCKGKIKAAVKNVSFDVSKEETIGLLGPNGAGKSTLINMIVNEIIPTYGAIEICRKNKFSKMGFCPQENSCWNGNTVMEHLYLFLDMKGAGNDKENLANFLIESLGLENHKNKIFKNLSGGNKRLLCFALSQIGPVDTVVLDEPTAGLDPVSKKSLWKFFLHLCQTNPRGVLLSTHSMEEAEALCTKLAIIVNGQIQCSGLTHQLKNNSNTGYTLELKLSDSLDSDAMTNLKQFVSNVLIPGSKVVTECHDWISYKVAQSEMPKMSNVFHLLETKKDELHLEDYSFSQATLEQVFLELFKFQVVDGSNGNTNLLEVIQANPRFV